MRVARVSARKAVAPYVSGKPGVCPRIATFDLIAFVNERSQLRSGSHAFAALFILLSTRGI
jgi:hypothetical protein